MREAGEIAARTDRASHRAPHRSPGNELLSELLDAFWSAFWSAFHQVRARGLGTAAVGAEPARTHARIVDAVRAGDAAAAERPAHRHYDGIRGRLSGH
ncbi:MULTISPECIES: FCD domain-containing protein [Streptomyces]|uniref:DNA-binding FadR family transcriptional regulator n=2 Tax=Streptomyces TaxID=1883 RepID=A0ABT9LAK1_STRGD|nr:MULTISPECIES: FCD domain-containing protein [Streptomyces]MDP9679792.1 DNA-binding FadR family transcriptional regulator [Streptomyces griseoviridis]GGT25020.1 hypothetical protein GCM10010240_66820 [Streptomyces griseoviridis]GGU59025.1 hypothetical protein GCM10010259_57540 [Streptomyces daghestanicus]GHI30067.1 hypothetical protein Sdagh_17970 [Streptomyces daghestanicus]